MAGGDPITEDKFMRVVAELRLEITQQLNSLATKEELLNLAAKVLSPDRVKEMITDALRDSSARGWTSKERLIAIITVLAVVGNLALAVYNARHHGMGK